MSVTPIKVDICNTGLILSGADPINSFDDETREARVSAKVYKRIANSRLESYPWRFSMKQVILSPVFGESPLFGFEKVFQLPGDRLRAVWRSYSGLNYRIVGDKLYANGDRFLIEYQYKVPEELWTESFTHMIELEMTAIYLRALFDDANKSFEYTKQGGLLDRQSRIARSVDSQQQASDTPDEGEYLLTAVRL